MVGTQDASVQPGHRVDLAFTSIVIPAEAGIQGMEDSGPRLEFTPMKIEAGEATPDAARGWMLTRA